MRIYCKYATYYRELALAEDLELMIPRCLFQSLQFCDSMTLVKCLQLATVKGEML